MIGEIIGAGLNLIQPWLGAMYNSPKAQIRRLEKAGFHKNAYLAGASGGTVDGFQNISLSPDFGLDQAKSLKAQGALDTEQARVETSPTTFLEDTYTPFGVQTEVSTDTIMKKRAIQELGLNSANIRSKEAQIKQIKASTLLTDAQKQKVLGTLEGDIKLSEYQWKVAKEQAAKLGAEADNVETLKRAMRTIIDGYSKKNEETGEMELSPLGATIIMLINMLGAN